MYDNGLLEYYRSLKHNNGFLNVSSLGVNFNYLYTKNQVVHEDIKGKPYYIKSATPTRYFTKQMCDAEILLSQIYNKAGIQSAVYLPARNNSSSFLICNDVAKEDIVLASDYLIKKCDFPYLPFLAPLEELRAKPTDIYTLHAMKQQTLMRVLDTASFNYDRHGANFFYKLQPTTSIQNSQVCSLFNSSQLEPNPQSSQNECVGVLNTERSQTPRAVSEMVDDVVAIDFGVSGSVIAQLENNPDADKFNIYKSDFATFNTPREKVIKEIRTNERFAELVDKQELAETIGGINPSSIAEDIKQTTGYEVNPVMIDILSKSFDDMAEGLVQ